MPAADLFRRTLEAGSSIVGVTRERAEAVVKEWVEAGDLGKSKAQKAVDDMLDRSRRATADIRALVRREVSDQLVALGVATKDDIARLEARLDDTTTTTTTTPTPGEMSPPTGAAPITKVTTPTPPTGAGEA